MSRYATGQQNPDGDGTVRLKGKADVNNSTNTPLGVGASFTGTATNLDDWVEIIVTCYTDVTTADNGLSVQFSSDGSTDWRVGDAFTLQAGDDKTFTFQPQRRYFRVVYTNGPTEQTGFDLQVQLRTSNTKHSSHRLGDAIHQEDDAELVKSVLSDANGHLGKMSFMRTLATHSPYRLLGSAFEGATLDTNFWTGSASGTGASNVQDGGHVLLTSGTDNDGYAQVQSARKARFIFAHPMLFRIAFSTADPTQADVTKRAGVFTVDASTPPEPVDGYWGEINADGTVAIGYAKDGVATTIQGDAFNRHHLIGIDNKVHAFEIHYFLMRVEWYLDGVLIHVIDTTDLTDDATDSLSLPITTQCFNSATGTTSGSWVFHAAVVIREGRYETTPESYFQSGTTAGLVLKRGGGALRRLVVSNVSNNAVITLYDNTAASGTIIWASGSMGAQTQPFDVTLEGVPFDNGLTLVISGATCNVVTIYE